MKYVCLVLVSLMSVVSGAFKDYPMGCLDEPQTSRLSAGMVLHFNHSLVLGGFDQHSSTVVLRQLGISYKSLLDLPDAAEMFCSAVHDQTPELGTCTVFAIASGLESLLAGRNISRAELYLRVKTKGKSSLDSDGCYLRETSLCYRRAFYIGKILHPMMR